MRESLLAAFLALLLIGVVLGLLFGLGELSVMALDLAFFGGLALFVPWAVLRLDPRRLADSADSD
jgi:uncharacterized membrane protein YhaH (DUF805 family)